MNIRDGLRQRVHLRPQNGYGSQVLWHAK